MSLTINSNSVIHNTFVIERSYPVAPPRVFLAFSDPVQKRRWFVENEHSEVEHYELDFQVGGHEKARFRFSDRSPLPGLTCTNQTIYQDIVPDRRIVFASTMSIGETRISSSLVTFEFLANGTGTELIFTHQGAFFEGSDGPEMRQDGWQKLLDNLAPELAHG